MKRPRQDVEASHRLISRRAAILGGVQLAFVAGLGARMQFLQVEQADQFRLLAEENRINIRIIPPARGEVFDRNGVPLARNVPSYRIVAVREDTGDIEEVLSRLGKVVALDEEEIERAKAEMKRSAPFLPVTVADEVTWD
ncbi:MAG: penicillin-binding protein 2, partial [Tateyamaria sp.]